MVKTVVSKKTIKEEHIKITCLKCNELKTVNPTNFYVNTNPLFNTEKLHVCKKCIQAFIGKHGSSGYEDRVKLVLGFMNKPFIINIWEDSNKDWNKYIPQISSFHKDKTFAESEFVKINSLIDINNELTDEIQLSEEDIKQLQLKWGKTGFEIDDYMFLENEFHTWINSYECDSYAMEMLFQEISHKRLEIKKLRESGKPTDKEMKTLQDLLGSSNIKPVQETGANATEQATFGTLIKKYENERPIPEPDESLRDVDGIKKYIQIWFLGHLCKMLGINNEYAKMYEEEVSKHTVDTPEYEDDSEEVTGL